LRSYEKVSFLEYTEVGLLDTGSNVSCIGSTLAAKDFSRYPAGGESQKIVGVPNLEITYNKMTLPMQL